MNVNRLAVVVIVALGAGSTNPALAQHAPCAAQPGGIVGPVLLNALLAQWTADAAYAPCPPFRPHDFNRDCKVNGLDLAMLLAAWGTACGAPTRLELAGNSLTSFPYFEYVRAINRAAPLKVAIDPTRFPAIVGQTCRIFVVEHKSTADWIANPTLTDVTALGGVLSGFVAGPAGGQIQANTVEIDPAIPGPPHGLSAQASEPGLPAVAGGIGSGLGHGYDVVLDCNQNGVLDGADFVDGMGDEAGFYVVHDVTQAGPYAITAMTYLVDAASVPAGFRGQQTFFPTDIATLGQLPLAVISHGNGHDYRWYDHIGNHLASYGWIVMSHQNNTVPGPSTAARTTFQHTNAIIAQQAAIPAGHPTVPAGVLNGHIDTNRIVWIGHSRGAEGVVIAYHLALSDLPVGWTPQSVRLISSIAPTDFHGWPFSSPLGANFHLWTGGSDADVNGCANCNLCQTFHLHDRATGFRQSISLHGTGHGDFHNGLPPVLPEDAVADGAGFPAGTGTLPSTGVSFPGVAFGPCQIGRVKAHAIVRGYLLPLVKRYVNNNLPAKDFLWRQWERFKPIGAPAEAACAASTGVDVVVNLMYKDGPTANNFVIDDYQTQLAPGTASSGATVASTVGNLVEGLLDDDDTAVANPNNETFTWVATDPMNGATLGGQTLGPAGGFTFDITRGVVFNWAAASHYTFTFAAAQNLTPFKYLSFRAAQGTRHPNTIPPPAPGVGALEDLTFRISLHDGANTSSINISAYGGGVEEPYQRVHILNGTVFSAACGDTTPGWHNEFETIRIRLTDFLNNASALNLANITEVRFEFAQAALPGPPGAVPAGSPRGRLSLDDVELTTD